ncbi:MAG TPA: zinc ribbon domain-containing protein [Mycobacteriales bacterium]|nr:zinc ribbon domain-containing protein [Mycobacteriales bacterium]
MQSRQLTEARAAFGWLAAGSVTVSAPLSTGELLRCPGPSPRRAAPGRNVAHKAGLNRAILADGWGQLVARREHKAPSRVTKVNSAYTSQPCSHFRYLHPDNRENQAVFWCRSCGHASNADANAALHIAAGHAVTARRCPGLPGPVNGEPQRLAS